MTKEISAAELQQLLDSEEIINLIDVREPEEWEAGHIAAARSIPLSVFQARSNEVFDTDGEVIIICHSGGRSNRVCEYLAGQGFDVTNVYDGMLGWRGDVTVGE